MFIHVHYDPIAGTYTPSRRSEEFEVGDIEIYGNAVRAVTGNPEFALYVYARPDAECSVHFGRLIIRVRD